MNRITIIALDNYIKNVKSVLKSRGLTQKDLAVKANMSESTLRKVISRVNECPRQETLNAIADALEIERFSYYDSKVNLMSELCEFLNKYEEDAIARFVYVVKESENIGMDFETIIETLERKVRQKKRSRNRA